MLSTVGKKLRQLYSRIRWLIWKRPRPKVIIRRFGKVSSKDRCKWEAGIRKKSPVYVNGKPGCCGPAKAIRIATFNVAMFSLAPAVSKAEESAMSGQEQEDYAMLKSLVEMNSQAKSANHRPKGILKQSPLHANTRSPEQLSTRKVSGSVRRVSINLPDNEISLAQGKFLSFVEEEREASSNITAGRNYRSNAVMRSPVCLPANMSVFRNDQETFRSSRSVLEVLREVDADILALQDVKAEEEKGMSPLSDLAASLGMTYVFAESWAPEYGNAILSKWPIRSWKVQKIANDEDFRNVLKATVYVPWAGEVDFYCTQLDHFDENWRMKQISALTRSNDRPHILAGGLNSLDGTDYSPERWMDIVKYYEDIGKPTPKVEVTKFLRGKEYVDAKECAGECEPVVIIAKGQNVQGTCKYGTRVDYILASADSPYKFVPGSYSVVSSKGTSDHHIVKVDVTKVTESHHGSTIKPHPSSKAERSRIPGVQKVYKS